MLAHVPTRDIHNVRRAGRIVVVNHQRGIVTRTDGSSSRWVQQTEKSVLIGFGNQIVGNEHVKRLLCFAGRKTERAESGGIVRALTGAVSRDKIVDTRWTRDIAGASHED